jgi:hypothetical protein
MPLAAGAAIIYAVAAVVAATFNVRLTAREARLRGDFSFRG